ncbi:MAG: S46 family peptidase [Deltaproteobacteria bacterium]|nr:S46 family peptidase [Deltaproteobacteria bacterium]
MRLSALAVAAVVAGLSLPAFADEGMWTFNNFPADKVAAKYGFKPDQAWLDRARLGSARLAGGCSASFVSPDGLVMTNHHCAHQCIHEVSTKAKDYVKDGFTAKDLASEPKCPAMEVNQLTDITDVTARMNKATSGKTGPAYIEAQKAESAVITKECSTSDLVRCDVVSLYKGGKYDLYKYKRYQDVRLVFAPELAIAFFGGDPDNFNFPRYDLDVSFIRVYENGKPAATPAHFPFAKTPTKKGDLVFVSGHPGNTSREDTVAELAFERDFGQPARLLRLAEMRGQLTQFGTRGAEQRRISESYLFSVENSYKARLGRQSALTDKAFFESKVKAQGDLINSIKDAKKKQDTVKAVGDIDAAMVRAKEIWPSFINLEVGWAFPSETFDIARGLLRASDELALPNEKRLKEYTDAVLPGTWAELTSPAPIYPEFEVLKLTFGLTKLRETLTADDPTVKKILGKKSPATLASELIKGSKLADPKARRAYLKYEDVIDPKTKKKVSEKVIGVNKAAIDMSKDPMILFARLVDADARRLRKSWEDEVESIVDQSGETIAKARFDAYGTSLYPDATFTLRLSYGAVEGWKERGTEVNPLTVIAGAFERHTGEDPFKLPASWLKAQKQLDLTKPMNMATTNDIIGGNSGSPVINKDAEVVGLIFDGNIHSLGGDYGFNPTNNRAISVHTAAILEAIDKVYGAKALADELGGKRPAAATAAAPAAGSGK